MNSLSTTELNCTWNFADMPENGYGTGPNEPMAENFKKTPYASIVREAIQNSLDERYDKSKPLEMIFKINEMPLRSYPNFCDIKTHIQGCLDLYNNAKDIYQPMIDYLNLIEQSNAKLPYIQISDYNANGMPFQKNSADSPFTAFVRAAGLSTKKNNNAGGPFGFGKAAYFYLSPIRTILVSTLTKDGNCFFEGVASLCTHLYNDIKKMPIGYFDSNNGSSPISNNDAIPPRFRRLKEKTDSNRPGTDIFIMGIKQETGTAYDIAKSQIYSEMKLAILRNFWMAIYEEMLTVTVGDETICKKNLLQTMETSFSDEDDSSKSLSDYNPLPYLKMVINADAGNKNYHKFEMNAGEQDPESKAILYLHKKRTANDRVLFMRSPRMLVKAETKRSKRGFYGTFICTGGFWDTLLRSIENPAHNEWDKRNYDKNPEIAKMIDKYLNVIFKFVRDKIDGLFAQGNSLDDTIKDLDQYLYIPTEVDEEDDDFTQESIVGNPTGEMKDDGTSINSDSNDIVIPKQDDTTIQKGIVLQPRTQPTVPDTNGNHRSGHGNSRKNKGGNQRGSRYINKRERESDINSIETTSLYTISVNYRTFAQYENDKLIHNIIIHSDYDILNGRIDLKVGTEETDESLSIIWTDHGEARDNTIINLSLKQGINKIKIRFADNMKHAIKLDTYEIK